MDFKKLYDELIGERIKPIIFEYKPYKDVYKTYSYHHILDDNFEQLYSKLLFDSIVFYAYEKDEIEKEYKKGHLNNLTNFARVAYNNRVPKTEKLPDGLLGELSLDCFIRCFFPNIQTLYSRVKYLDKIPDSNPDVKKKGHEVKGYDALVFSCEKDKKYMWVGQVKTGTWNYCFNDIKKDINKSILESYFASSMIITSDIMMSQSNISEELKKIIDDINDIVIENIDNINTKYREIVNYFINNKIIVRVPCLIIADEKNYDDKDNLLKIIKEKCHKAFNGFTEENNTGLDLEIFLLVFPVRDLTNLRINFLEERLNGKN